MNMICNVNFKKLFLVFTASLFLGLFSPFSRIYAQENLKSVLREVAGKIEGIGEIENNRLLTDEQRGQREATARKEALGKIFDLTLLEDKDLKNKLNNLENLSEDQETAREILLSIFTENENAYQEMQKRLAAAKTLEEVKRLAVDFKNWRNIVYSPKVEKIISFVLVFQQQKTLAIAQERLAKIKADLEELENSGLVTKEDTDNLIQIAESSLQKAEEINKQAEKNNIQIINQSLYPQNMARSLLEIFGFKNSEPPKALVAKSLGKIKIAYAAFLDISNLVKDKIQK
ncbi:MAG: hypothetical protein HZB99_03930 [Candidatus Harrisonbacteria bacterium]|nr:hypothetical protein [Candidatus Harrisonbacteria bacterium]